MTTITREQVQKIIDAADEVITALAGTNDDVHPDNSTKMTQLYDDLNDHYAPPEVVRELARIALASLEAEPVSETYNLPELIEGMEVSIDVSTCDADAGNRYFGTVTEVSELYTAKNGYILLVQDAKPNFDVNGNSPVIPDGYALVPVEPTDEMIAAAMNCEDVLFNSDESFCVQFGNIYEAMLAAAPQPEVK
ncbi:hypothetical protein VV40_004824 [Salmonella enterica subsp. enterica serovar Pomona]|uniref:hypothetical protein n=1 Tax=Salmonella enterica TaxID=28901 RepID=UPI001414B1BE|nr:hypothetical protein [Salmonella enterica]EBV7013373.1 hypothetical protein [Salmonella enterica subsp. enterica serovar Pomona]ECJ6076677.1 hypothetical protein [Salmonella enterica]EDT8704669.1 hypothetical protein [Salmonella enterica subsp. enterica serovar Pomona]EIB0268068.1 hypothetical protein [Salmonella enterica]MCT6988503.1 hypothetical protein [Salmonella enterica subsp. enterica serovar Give]